LTFNIFSTEAAHTLVTGDNQHICQTGTISDFFPAASLPLQFFVAGDHMDSDLREIHKMNREVVPVKVKQKICKNLRVSDAANTVL